MALASDPLRGSLPAFSGLIELGKEHLLPGSEEHRSIDGDGQGVADERLPNVGVPVAELILLEVLRAGGVVVMLVVALSGYERIDEAPEVVEKPVSDSLSTIVVVVCRLWTVTDRVAHGSGRPPRGSAR